MKSPVPKASLLRFRPFLWLWGGDAVSQLGTQFTQLAIPVIAVTLLSATEWQVGLLTAAETAAFLIVGLPAGAWIDRMLKRRVMIFADLVRALALAVIPVLWFMGLLEMWHLIIVGTVIGVATVFFDVAYQSFIPVLVRSEQVGRANSYLETTGQISRIGGPGLAGVLLTVVSAPVLIIVDAFSFLISALALSRVRDKETRRPGAERESLPTEIAEGLRFVFRHPILWRITATTATSNLFGMFVSTLEVILILREIGLTPAALGLIFGIGSTGGLLGALATPWLTKRVGEGTAVSLSALAMGVTYAAVPLSGMFPGVSLPILIAGAFVQSFLVLVYNITQVTMRQRLTPPRLLGRMNASIRFVVWGVNPIGALVAGAVGTAIGIIPTMWIGVGGGIIAASWVLFSPITRMRVLPTELAATEE